MDINQALIYVNQTDAKNLLRYPTNNISGWRLFLTHPLEISSVTKTPLPEGLYLPIGEPNVVSCSKQLRWKKT